MTPREFVIWLKGFIQAANKFAATPQQWDDIRDQLNKVELEDSSLKYIINENSSISFSNPRNAESTVTYGRPEDKITYTND